MGSTNVGAVSGPGVPGVENDDRGDDDMEEVDSSDEPPACMAS